MGKLSEEKLAEIKEFMIENWATMNKHEIADRCGIPYSTLYLLARQIGSLIKHPGEEYGRTPKHIVDKVRELYPVMPTKEIARTLGLSGGCISYLARAWNLRKDEEYQRSVYIKLGKSRIGTKKSEEEKQRLRASMKRTRRKDERRILSGEKPLTKWKFRTIPRHIILRRWILINKRGYIASPDRLTLWYDEKTLRVTRRTEGSEEYMAKKYHLRFEPLPKDEEHD